MNLKQNKTFTTKQLYQRFLKNNNYFKSFLNDGKKFSYKYFEEWCDYLEDFKMINIKRYDKVEMKWTSNVLCISDLDYPFFVVDNGLSKLNLPISGIHKLNNKPFTLLWAHK